MKSLLRSGPVAALLGWAIWSYMALCARTMRWRIEGAPTAKSAWGRGAPVIVAAWHRQILLLPAGWIKQMRRWPGRRAPSAMMISLSPDGEPVAKAIRHLGLEAVRGSARHKRKGKDKGGREAIAAALGVLEAGGALCLTPDGPRGPSQKAGPGPALIARRAHATLLPYALAARPAFTLDTWDRFILPLPFSRGAIVFGSPIDGGAAEATAPLTEALQIGLDAANARAETLCGGAPARERADQAEGAAS